MKADDADGESESGKPSRADVPSRNMLFRLIRLLIYGHLRTLRLFIVRNEKPPRLRWGFWPGSISAVDLKARETRPQRRSGWLGHRRPPPIIPPPIMPPPMPPI